VHDRRQIVVGSEVSKDFWVDFSEVVGSFQLDIFPFDGDEVITIDVADE
jgi:hypothetical protein